MNYPDEYMSLFHRLTVVASTWVSPQDAEGVVRDERAGIWEKQNLRLQMLFRYAGAYAFMAVKSGCAGILRMKQRMRARYDNMCMQSHDMVDSEEPRMAMEYKELESRIRNAVKSLKGRHRQVFLLSREEGCRNAEIASRLGISVNTVECHMVAALKKYASGFMRHRRAADGGMQA